MRIIIFFALLCVYKVGFSQVYEIKYHHNAIYKPLKGEGFFSKQSPAYMARVEKMFRKEASRIRVFTLLFSGGKSKCSIEPYTILDDKKDFDARRVDGYGDFYKDFSKGYYVQVADFIGRNTAVREYFSEIFTWKLDQDRDTTIYGIPCKRATTKYNGDPVVAWFAPSIPIMDGPMRYAGLPGLILRIETGSAITEVADIQVLKNNNEGIVIPEKKKYISFKEMKESRSLTVKAKRIKKKDGQNHK